MKTTLGVVARAIRKNGYKQAIGTFVEEKNGKVVAACALGQAALNLHCDPHNLVYALDRIKSADGIGLGQTIINWNDTNKWTLAYIAERIEKDWTDDLSATVCA